jgi:ADP-ribose pyrophosphatase YjhB (NUDIX family)
MATNYCIHCGGSLGIVVPEGDDRPRNVCPDCGRIHYRNPKVVVGCIADWNDQILLCQRAIEPRLGKWTLPAGYLEEGESVVNGAIRETYEEAEARVEELTPFGLFNLTFVSQIYIMFRARLIGGHFGKGPESKDVRLFGERDVPWDDLAFSVMRETLRRYFRDRGAGQFQFHMSDISRDFLR